MSEAQHGTVVQPKVCRLSVIITVPTTLLDLPLPGMPPSSQKAFTERAVESVLKQRDPIGIEVVVAIGAGPQDKTADHLEAIFGAETASRRLQILRLDRTGDPGTLRNQAVARSQGTYLAFLDPPDFWRPGHLTALEPWLSRHDLILGTEEKFIQESADWVRSFIAGNWGLTSTAVIRRSLFEEVGGFPEGYFGIPLPKRLPGMEDYEFWLRCLICLGKTERRDRFALIPNQTVEIAPERLQSITPIHQRVKLLREAVSLLHIAPKMPARYWGTLAKRVVETSKAMVKKPGGGEKEF